MNTCSRRHGDHQPVERYLVAYDLSQFARKIKGLEAVGVFEGGIAKHHHGNGFAGQGTRQVGHDFENSDAPFIDGFVERRSRDTPDLVDFNNVTPFGKGPADTGDELGPHGVVAVTGLVRTSLVAAIV